MIAEVVSSRRREVNRTEYRYIECLDVSLAFTSRGSMMRPRSELHRTFSWRRYSTPCRLLDLGVVEDVGLLVV